MSDMKYAFFLLLATIVGLVIDHSFVSGASVLGMGDSFTAVPNPSKSNKLSSRNSPGHVTVAAAAAAAAATANTSASSPSMPSSRTAAGDEVASNVNAAPLQQDLERSRHTAPWNYEDKAILAGQKNIDPSQTDAVIPAQNRFGYQQQPAIPSSSSNDSTNASISIQILRVGGPIGLLIILVILIYWLFFKNNCPCSDSSTAGETNFKCDISLSCSG